MNSVLWHIYYYDLRIKHQRKYYWFSLTFLMLDIKRKEKYVSKIYISAILSRWYPDKRSHLNQNLLQICKNFKAFHYQSTFFFKTITWEKQTYYDTLSQNIERYEARSFLSKVWKLITFQVFTHFVYYVKIEHLSLCFYLLRDRSAKNRILFESRFNL